MNATFSIQGATEESDSRCLGAYSQSHRICMVNELKHTSAQFWILVTNDKTGLIINQNFLLLL